MAKKSHNTAPKDETTEEAKKEESAGAETEGAKEEEGGDDAEEGEKGAAENPVHVAQVEIYRTHDGYFLLNLTHERHTKPQYRSDSPAAIREEVSKFLKENL